ncbi:hypothetical protein FIBSPDRAFT_801111 [Athelia psychrophila]|uniref:Adipose-regulatory protein n=1 Tax=Athelia psychrophila TaxID=1759441 RepID=A0A165ZFY8_9AGAM|nr:hypothetical protein FIBSPDRAFT_801111 [Fibularhizoctonia sp. CBS 109695]
MFSDDRTAVLRDEVQEDTISDVLLAPVRFSGAVAAKGVGYIRPIVPQLVSLSVCLLLVPLLVLFSALSGWYVWKNIAIGWNIPVYLHYGDGIPPYAEIQLPRLSAQQPYNIFLHLNVPATESNFALGNFMTQLTLATPSNRTLAYIRRPAIITPPHSSFWITRPSSVDLTVPLLTAFTPGTSQVVGRLELGRRDEWRNLGQGHGRELSVLSVSLRGVTKPEGLRGLISRFPLLSGLTSSVIFLGISLLFLTAVFLPTVFKAPSPQPEHIDEIVSPSRERLRKPKRFFDSDGGSDSPDEKPPVIQPSRRNTSSRSRRSSSNFDVKTEASSTVFPEDSVSTSAPLRRRRSQQLGRNQTDGYDS